MSHPGVLERVLLSLQRDCQDTGHKSEEAPALLWTTAVCIAGTNCPQGSVSHCVTQDTFAPVLIAFIFSQSLKGEIWPHSVGDRNDLGNFIGLIDGTRLLCRSRKKCKSSFYWNKCGERTFPQRIFQSFKIRFLFSLNYWLMDWKTSKCVWFWRQCHFSQERKSLSDKWTSLSLSVCFSGSAGETGVEKV